MSAVFQALYTPNLTQKRKKWFDGKCKFWKNKVRLTDAEGRVLAEKFWSSHNENVTENLPEAGTSIQFERFLVELDSLITVSQPHEQAPTTGVNHPATTTRRELVSKLRKQSVGSPTIKTGLSKGPPLSEILKGNPVRAVASPSFNRAWESPVKPKRQRKYLPWGDAMAPDPVSMKKEHADVTNFKLVSDNVEEEDLFVTSSPQPISLSQRQPLVFSQQDTNENKPSDNENFCEQETISTREITTQISINDYEDDVLEPTNITIPRYYSLDSDLESDNELEIVDVANVSAPRPSMFNDIPDYPPIEGPWTKEAYILFSWHPPASHTSSYKHIKNEPE